jgi:hypothetical protein
MIDVYRTALADCLSILRLHSDADWSPQAVHSDETILGVGAHIADTLIAYAGQIASQPSDHWVPIHSVLDDGTGVHGLLEAIASSGRIFDVIAEHAPSTTRAFHSWGMSDTEGFLAMACVELLVHTNDVVSSLEGEFSVDDELVEPVLHRLFRDVPTGGSRWEALLWSTGRIAIPSHPQQASWRWYADVQPE